MTSALSRSAAVTSGTAQLRKSSLSARTVSKVALSCMSSRVPMPLRVPAGSGRVSGRRAAVVKSSSAPSDNESSSGTPQVESTTKTSMGQMIGNFGFIGLFLGSVIYAGFISFQKIQTDPENVGVLAGPPSAFAGVFLAFALYKAVAKAVKNK
eukprot:CAMPEP_0117672620 /NCGR_PEP_ID=MMETSP0804-20121206/14003_1 /TAXON_ID=1074897 /ORGANISM="Tetraselmis astigmatica, Strain CCMP880" /LENGTH=152 /DNA_ID=CAMNT_0005481237 /DNA_START=100 /DNA_END=558 /DNA_ORIENTATION=-